MTREHYYRPDWQYTPGRVVLRGGRAERDKPRMMDYLLRYTDSFPIAVVEAKAEYLRAVAGLEQADTDQFKPHSHVSEATGRSRGMSL